MISGLEDNFEDDQEISIIMAENDLDIINLNDTDINMQIDSLARHSSKEQRVISEINSGIDYLK